MKKKIKDRWIKALRSRKYKQGTGQLLNEYGEYCCLGVLCDLYAKSKEGKKNNAHFKKNGDFIINGSNAIGVDIMPDIVREWAGLDRCDPIIRTKTNYPETYGYSSASFLNDNGHKFYQIARLIERNL